MSSLSSETFSYVFIPANDEEPIELRHGDKSGGLSNDFLIKTAKEYFYQQSDAATRAEALAQASPAQRQALAKTLRTQMPHLPPDVTDDALLDLAMQSQQPSCEIVALTVPTRGNQHRAVSLYAAQTDNEDKSQNLPHNARATALLMACGHVPAPAQDEERSPGIYGDVFVGRCCDNEETDEWERLDFAVEDADPSADWCAVARSVGGGGGSGTGGPPPASLSGLVSQSMAKRTKDDEDGSGVRWSQTDDEVELKFSVASGTKAKYVKVQFGRTSLKVTVAGQTLVNGMTGGKVSVEECTYTIQDDAETGKRELCIILGKNETGTVWPYAVKVS